MRFMHSKLVQNNIVATAADAELSRLKLFEGDILLVDGDKPYGFRKKRSDIMTSSDQEANMMGMGDTAKYTHMWQNRTVYYTYGQTLGELLETLSIIIYLAPSAV